MKDGSRVFYSFRIFDPSECTRRDEKRFLSRIKNLEPRETLLIFLNIIKIKVRTKEDDTIGTKMHGNDVVSRHIFFILKIENKLS